MDGFFLTAYTLAFHSHLVSERKEDKKKVETRFVRTTNSFSIRTKEIAHTLTNNDLRERVWSEGSIVLHQVI